MKRRVLWLVLPVTLLAACGMPRSPEEQAQRLFRKGEKYILRSLEAQGASSRQLQEAQAVLARHRKGVTEGLAALIRKHRALFAGVASGKDTEALVALEQALHRVHEQTVRRIGAMHEDLEAAVGESLWKATTAAMASKWARHGRE